MVSNNDKPLGTNKIISGMFAQMADALTSLDDATKGHPHNHISNKEVGVNPFKITAYRKAAKVLADYPVDVEETYKKGGIKALTAIPGIGAALSKKIVEFIDTGRMHKYDEIMAQRPKGSKKHKGFTLTELLIVLLIMGILAAIAIVSYTPFLNKVKELAGW